jgi:3-deoxy-manno-octulosonate cytidylyltransferase (CMP-KDO synthetase)
VVQKLVALIPARLKSKRIKNKVLYLADSLPIIEHVRRRVLISGLFSDVIIVTGDKKIIELVKKNKGKVIESKKKHTSGTSRCAEIANNVKGDIFVIIFADELFILPSQLKTFCNIIKKDKISHAWNATTQLEKKDLFLKEVVKCELDKNNFIKNFFRLDGKNSKVKSVGILALRRKLLLKYNKIKKTKKEIFHSIEQFRLIENKYYLRSVFIKNILNSINVPEDIKRIEKQFIKKSHQNKILKATKNFNDHKF